MDIFSQGVTLFLDFNVIRHQRMHAIYRDTIKQVILQVTSSDRNK